MNIVTSQLSDYNEIVAFGNRIFNVEFETLLPKLYKQAEYVADNHYLIKQDDGIKAMVGSFVNELTVLDETLSFHGIGTVSVDPATRGSGFMKQLMSHAIDQCKSLDVDFMILGGQRQRYEYFGFTPCSTELEFTSGESAFRHMQRFSKAGITFAPLNHSPIYVKDCAALYSAQPLHAKRNEQEFEIISQSWHAVPYAILYNGTFCGYLVAGDNFHIKELVLMDYTNTIPMILSWVQTNDLKNLSVCVQFFQLDLIQELDKVMEDMRFTRGQCINVLNYKRVLKSALKLKNTHTPLVHGKLVIDVQEGGRYRIVVDASGITVEDCNELADVSLPHLRMMQFLFSPANVLGYSKTPSKIISRWFPVPFGISSLDNS